jgi:hypothetical protein
LGAGVPDAEALTAGALAEGAALADGAALAEVAPDALVEAAAEAEGAGSTIAVAEADALCGGTSLFAASAGSGFTVGGEPSVLFEISCGWFGVQPTWKSLQASKKRQIAAMVPRCATERMSMAREC